MKKSGFILVIGLVFLLLAGGAQASFVTIADFSDSTPGTYFLMPTEVTSIGNDTIFTVPLAVGGFSASAASAGAPVVVGAHDNISFNLVAGPGYYISKVEYTESGTGTASGGAAIAQGGVAINLVSTSFPVAIYTAPSIIPWVFGPAVFDFTGMNLTTIPVTIDNSLTAVALTLGSSATISKDPATLIITTTPVPLPPAVLLLGSGLVAFIGIRRRSLNG